MVRPEEKAGAQSLYLHVNTLLGIFNMSQQMLNENAEQAYIDQIDYSERNFIGKVRDISPLPYRKELKELVHQMNNVLGAREFGNGMAVRVSWIHGSEDLPTPAEVKRAGGYLILKSYVGPCFGRES